MIKKFCLIILNRLWQLLALIIISFAVIVTVARFMIPGLNNHLESIEQSIFKQTGLEVSIGQINGSWESLGPVIKLSNIKIENHQISINSIDIKVATFPTLFYQTLVTEQLVIDGLSLVVNQDQQSTFSLENTSNKTGKSTIINKDFASDLQDWLQHQSQILLFNTQINLSLINDRHYPITLDTIQFKKGKGLYQIIGLSKLPGANQIAFTIEADGFLSDPKTTAKLYLDTYQINMTELPLNSIWQEAKILKGNIELKFWLDWKDRHFDTALLSMKVDNFLMSLKGESQTELNKLHGYLEWSKQPQGWKLESKQLELISQNRSWPDPSLLIEMHKDAERRDYTFSATSLDLGIWGDIILTNPDLDDEMRQQLFTMNPNGFINQAKFSATLENQQLINFNAQGDFFELSWHPWGSLPGVSNFSGNFQFQKDRGEITLNASDVVLDYPSMFKTPLHLDNLNSELSWQSSQQQLNVELANLSIDTKDAQLLVDGKFNYLFAEPDSSDFDNQSDSLDLNIYAELFDVNLGKLETLLPAGTMSESLYNYLATSIKSGKMDTAQILLRGKAKDYPFDRSDGVFIANAQLSDTQLDFYEHWPVIDNMSVELSFLEKRLEIKLAEGYSNGLTLSNTLAVIPDLTADINMLEISNLTKGELTNGIDYINNSPLNDSVGKVFNVISADGLFALDLQLLIPLSGDEPTNDKAEEIRIDGKISLNNNTVNIKSLNLLLENIQGEINIADSLISAENITAFSLGAESQLSIQQTVNADGLLTTKIASEGELHINDLRLIFPDWLPKEVTGVTSYSLALSLPEVTTESDLVMDLAMQSNLLGVTNHLPLPFTKLDTSEHSFKLHYQLYEDELQLFNINLAHLVDLNMQYSEETSTRGQIIFGDALATIPSVTGIEITGRLSQLNIEPWLDLIGSSNSDDNSSNGESLSEKYAHFYVNKLHIDQLNYHFLSFDDVDIASIIDKNTIQLNLNSEEIVGDIVIPNKDLQQPIKITLSKLQIRDQFPNATSEDVSKPLEETSIQTSNATPLPAIILSCEQCIYNEQLIGSAKLSLNPLENGNHFKLNIDDTRLMGLNIEGQWQQNQDETISTSLNGSLESDSLGNLLSLFNLDAGIKDTPIKSSGELSWQGDISQFNAISLSGMITLKGENGSQQYVSDRDARIFSILSLGSLARKLTLDFSDLFEDGFFYTDFEATLNLKDGVVSTEDFVVTGTSADVKIIGSSDFVNNRIENCILVTPDLSASLPVLAGWAIEPMTGLVVFLMSKIFEPAIRVVTSIQYKIEGSFDDPIITEMGKSAATAIVDNTQQTTTTFIQDDPEQPTFSCDNVFDK